MVKSELSRSGSDHGNTTVQEVNNHKPWDRRRSWRAAGAASLLLLSGCGAKDPYSHEATTVSCAKTLTQEKLEGGKKYSQRYGFTISLFTYNATAKVTYNYNDDSQPIGIGPNPNEAKEEKEKFSFPAVHTFEPGIHHVTLEVLATWGTGSQDVLTNLAGCELEMLITVP
jgi:hypothetical protein